jgi:hypothetical protein
MNKQATLAHTKALANYAQDWHQWHPTFTLGEKLCLMCGLRASCPICLSRPPNAYTKLLACALHRSERKEAEA